MEYLEDDDVYITYMPMPMRVKGFCKVVNGDDCAIINSNLAPDIMRATIRHEIKHLHRGDLRSILKVKELEDDDSFTPIQEVENL